MKRYRYFLLDIEGTIVLDKKYTPVLGGVKWFNTLAKNGNRVRLVTNNTTESPDDLYDILVKKGFLFEKQDYFTCLTETVVQMKRRNVTTCLVLAKKAVKQYLSKNGIKPSNSFQADAVLVGYDPTLTYNDMNGAVKAIAENHALLFTLHLNRRFVDKEGDIVMSAGPIAAALEFATLTRAIVCGKPSRQFFLDSIKGWDIPREKILMVSDDPFADLIGAKKLGMSTCWVLTGSQKDPAAVKKIPAKYRPDYILDSVLEIPF
jgi:phospholysine phosphohistidine inorganic pyrophosphate phosphatase